MGRLQALIVTLVLVGCDEAAQPSGPSRSRSDAVLTSASPTSEKKPVPSAKPSAAPVERKLCDKAPMRAGEPLPDEKLGRVGPHADGLPDALETGGGKWTWVNLWAGWCGPCKEEIPMLLDWEKKLSGSLRVAFVSMDDDVRLSEKFLAGVDKPSYLLEAKERDAWLDGVGLGARTTLPAHVLVDPAGKIRCVVRGSIEARDYAEVESLVKSKK